MITEKYNETLNKIKNKVNQLKIYGYNEESVEKIINYINSCSETDLLKINIVKLSKDWLCDKFYLLRLFLYCTKIGLFNLNYDIYCPECSYYCLTHNLIGDINNQYTCSNCKSSFKTDLYYNVSISFSLSESIKKIEKPEFFIDSYEIVDTKGKKNYIVSIPVSPFSNSTFEVELKPGTYRYFCPYNDFFGKFEVKDLPSNHLKDCGKSYSIDICVTNEGFDKSKFELFTGLTKFTVNNITSKECGFVIKRIELPVNWLPASSIISLQIFNQLFPSQIIAKNKSIYIGKIIFLEMRIHFSNSASILEEYFLEFNWYLNLVYKLVDKYNGYLYNICDNRLFISFSDNADATLAAIELTKIFCQKAKDYVRILINTSDTLLFNYNNKNFLFNKKNYSDRIFDYSEKNDFLITEDIFQNSKVKHLLKLHSTKISRISIKMKEIEKNFVIYKITI